MVVAPSRVFHRPAMTLMSLSCVEPVRRTTTQNAWSRSEECEKVHPCYIPRVVILSADSENTARHSVSFRRSRGSF